MVRTYSKPSFAGTTTPRSDRRPAVFVSELTTNHPERRIGLRVECGYFVETHQRARSYSRGRLRPLVGSHATATDGPGFLAAIDAAGFLHCADRMPLFTNKFNSNGCFQQGPRRISGEPLQGTHIQGS